MSAKRLVQFAMGFTLCGSGLALPCGHDGPDPFVAVIQNPVPTPVAQNIPEAQEMLLLEHAKRVVYRDTLSQVHVVDRITGTQKLLTSKAGPLFGVKDQTDELFLSQFPTQLWNVYSGMAAPLPILGQVRSAKRIGNSLSIATTTQGSQGSQLRVYRTNALGNPHLHCSSFIPNHWEWIEGTEFPMALLRERRANHFRTYEMDLSQCRFSGRTLWSEAIPGQLGPTRYFPQSQATATLFQNLTTHVRWETAGRCRYLNTEKPKAHFFTSKSPLLLTPGNQLQVFGLERGKTLMVRTPTNPNPDLFEVDSHRTLLFLGPVGSGFSLFDVDVDSVL